MKVANIKNDLLKKMVLVILIIFFSGIISGVNIVSIAVSNDTSLKSISINPVGTGLEQDQSNNKIYRVKVDNTVTSVSINAVPNSANSKVTITGNNELQVGTNKVSVNVTSEAGTSTEYIVYVRRASAPISEINVIPNIQEEGKVYENNSNGEGVIESNIKINNQELQNEEEQQQDTEKNDMSEIEQEIETNEKMEENQNDINNETNEKNSKIYVFVIIGSVLLILFIIIVAIKHKHK